MGEAAGKLSPGVVKISFTATPGVSQSEHFPAESKMIGLAFGVPLVASV
jgi:hypothetical protein